MKQLRINEKSYTGGMHVFYLCSGSETVGVLSFTEHEGWVHVDDVSIEEGWRGEGLSGCLYGHLREWMQARPRLQSVVGEIIHPAALKMRCRVFGKPDRIEALHDLGGSSKHWFVTHILR